MPIRYYILFKSDFQYEIRIKILSFTLFPKKKRLPKSKRGKPQKHPSLGKKEKQKNSENKLANTEHTTLEEKRENKLAPEKLEVELKQLEQLEEDTSEEVEKKSLFEKIETWWSILEDFEFERLIKPTKRLVFKIIKRLKPKIFNLSAEIGIDPYKTGLLMAFISQFHLSDNVQIIGNYEETKLEGYLELAGKLRLIYFAAPAVRFILSAPVLKLLFYVRKRRKEL